MNHIKMTEQVNELFTALSKFQGEMLAIKKTDQAHRNKYANINTILEACRPLLAKHGLSIQQHPYFDDNGIHRLLTMLCHNSGQYCSSSTKIICDESDIQSYGGAITYQRRYSLVSIIGLEQEDDDGEATRATTMASKPERVNVSQSQIDALTFKIKSMPSPADCLKRIYEATKTTNIAQISSKQYYWVINNCFNE